MVDIGLLDIIVGQNDQKDYSDLGDPHMTSFEFHNILNEGLVNSAEGRDLLGMSLQENGLIQNKQEEEPNSLALPPWDDDADSFLQSMLTGADHLDSQLGLNVETSTLDLNDKTHSQLGLSIETSNHLSVDTSNHLNTPRAMVSPGLDDTSRLLSPGLDDISPGMSDNGSSFLPSMDMDTYSSNSGSLLSPDMDSPYPNSPNSTHSMDLIDYISNDSDGGDTVGMVSRVDPVFQTTTGTTTIILPITDLRQMAPDQTVTVSNRRLEPRDQRPNKRRRNSASSNSDSGVDDTSSNSQGKYPRLELNEEELRMCAKEGLSFPSHYPLTREEERNLKRVRRKIRNKVSAQDSRKRKKEYMDNMEDRVKASYDQHQELKDKIKILESQNKTLAAQLRRLHQIVVNGGFRHGQTSTALMVLLLSTALFLIPGLRDQPDTKPEIDILRAVKLPPMPGQSRSLLQFNNDIADMSDFKDIKPLEADPPRPMEATPPPTVDLGTPASPAVTIKVEKGNGNNLPHTDHDYTFTYTVADTGAKAEPGSAWIEEDAPPKGYGAALKSEDEDRHMNVNVSSSGQGTRKVILQIPKDIK